MQQEFEAGTAKGFVDSSGAPYFPQQNGMLKCYNLLFVSPLELRTMACRHAPCTARDECATCAQ